MESWMWTLEQLTHGIVEEATKLEIFAGVTLVTFLEHQH